MTDRKTVYRQLAALLLYPGFWMFGRSGFRGDFGRPLRLQVGQLAGHPGAGPRVAEALGPDRDQRGSDTEQVRGVGAALHSAHSHDGDRDPAGDLPDLREGNGVYRGTRHSAGPAAEPGLSGAWVERPAA